MNRPSLYEAFHKPLKFGLSDLAVVAPLAVLFVAVFLVRYKVFGNASVASVLIGPMGVFSAAWAAALALPGVLWASHSEVIAQSFRSRRLYIFVAICNSTALGFLAAFSSLALFPLLAVVVAQYIGNRATSVT